MSHDPLPCPFCGGPAEVDQESQRSDRTDAWTFIRCKHRCFVAPYVSGNYETGYRQIERPYDWVDTRTWEEASRLSQEQALRRWNTRAQTSIEESK